MSKKRIDGETVELIEVHQLDYDYCGIAQYGEGDCTATAGGPVFGASVLAGSGAGGGVNTNATLIPISSDDFEIEFKIKSPANVNVAGRVFGGYHGNNNGFTVSTSNGTVGGNLTSDFWLPGASPLRIEDAPNSVFNIIKFTKVGTLISAILNDSIVDATTNAWDVSGAIGGDYPFDHIFGTSSGAANPEVGTQLEYLKISVNGVLVRDFVFTESSTTDNTGNSAPVATNRVEYLESSTGNPDLKCFHTLKTCQDTPNFDQTTKTLTLSKPQSATLKEQREIVEPYYAEFNGVDSQVSTVPFIVNDDRLYELEIQVYMIHEAGTRYLYTEVSGFDFTFITTAVDTFQFNFGGSVWTSTYVEGEILTIKVTSKRRIAVPSIADTNGYINGVLIHASSLTLPANNGSSAFFGKKSSVFSKIKILNFKAWADGVLIRGIPFNQSSEDLTGNTTPIDTNITYSEPNSFVDSTVYTIPVLLDKGTTTTPTKVNIGARSDTASPLGNFGTLTVNYQDIPHNDNVVDPYASERSWDALERGTFFTKFLARNLYYNARAYRRYTGFSGQYLNDFEVTHYQQDTYSRPDSGGRLTLSGVSPFRKLDARKSQYPTQSTSKLIVDMAASGGTITTDTEVNSAAELEENLIFIGGEIIKYTSVVVTSGVSAVYSGLIRGQFGTEETTHSIGDSAQHVIFFDRDKATSSLYNILTVLFDKAGFDPAILDLANWQTEINKWLLTYSRLERVIFQPIAIKELIGELSRECGFFTWFEETENLVKLLAIKPEIGALTLLTEKDNLLSGQTKPSSKTDARISEMWVDSNLIVATDDQTRRENYSNTNVRLSDSASPLKYGERAVFDVKSRWLYSQSQINALTSRTIRRYEDDAQFLNYALDIKDNVTVGQVVEIETSRYVDINGLPERRQWQVLARHRVGDTILIQAQEFYLTGNYFVIAPNGTPDYDLATDEQKNTYGYIGPLPDGAEYTIF